MWRWIIAYLSITTECIIRFMWRHSRLPKGQRISWYPPQHSGCYFFHLSLSTSSDSHLDAILNDQLFPCFHDPRDNGDLMDDLWTICDVSLCNIGMKTRKCRHSTVYEDYPNRRRTEFCWAADLFEDEAVLRWGSWNCGLLEIIYFTSLVSARNVRWIITYLGLLTKYYINDVMFSCLLFENVK